MRENRMHGLTGGSWKRHTDQARATEMKDTRGNPGDHSGSETYRRSASPRQLSTLHGPPSSPQPPPGENSGDRETLRLANPDRGDEICDPHHGTLTLFARAGIDQFTGISVHRDGERSMWFRLSVDTLAIAAAAVAFAPLASAAPTAPLPQQPASSCDSNYSGVCVPIDSDVDCAGGSGNGPSYVSGPVTVVATDVYGLDRDGNGTGCE
ncbi:hypothetical protein MDOR_29490 [Mycolicibacterium doricum]|uniref:Excalibur calcium-binding domain-containing protein n=1 Tax=Mycolicibacterium doricum TaxID=126673 RepID=A0A7I7VUX5_9MYCO|nr:hypothetical protein MDOR_29490 [Mycolicibacterium doricum]